MIVDAACAGLFVDINNDLYCSIWNRHKVIKTSLNRINNNLTAVAGTGLSGKMANMLDNPRGIFVDNNINLYIADCYNDRIQLFKNGPARVRHSTRSAHPPNEPS